MINQLMCILLPSLISLKTYDKIFGEEKNIRKRIEIYLKYVLFVNLISYAITAYIFKVVEFVYTSRFIVKYLVLSIIVGVLLPIIEKVIKDNVEIGFKVENNEEKD